MAKIFVFRHGQTVDNIEHDFSGIHDVDLTQAGIEEAEQIGEKLKNEKERLEAKYRSVLETEKRLAAVLKEMDVKISSQKYNFQKGPFKEGRKEIQDSLNAAQKNRAGIELGMRKIDALLAEIKTKV